MATLTSTFPTLLDLKNRLDSDDKIAPIVELLEEQNEILRDAVFVESSELTSHVTTVRTGLPSVAWKKLNYGVAPSKSSTVQVRDGIGNLYSVAEVDADLADMNGLKQEWMLSEHIPFLEAMNQELAETLIYGNEGTEPAAFTGLSIRYNDQGAENACNILTSAGTPDNTDNTSIWLVGWGPATVHMIYPKGSKAGLSFEDKSDTFVESQGGSGLRGRAYRRDYSWKAGLTVRDWRYVIRINFDLEDIVASAATGPDLPRLMAQAIRRIPNLGVCRPAFYANRDALDALDAQCNYPGRVQFQTVEDAQGREVSTFRKIPVRRCDAILSTESGI